MKIEKRKNKGKRNRYLKNLLVIVFLFVLQIAYAQADPSTDFMRSIGKIYVVAGVTLIILVTLFIYMIIIDRKISRLEKRQKHE